MRSIPVLGLICRSPFVSPSLFSLGRVGRVESNLGEWGWRGIERHGTVERRDCVCVCVCVWGGASKKEAPVVAFVVITRFRLYKPGKAFSVA